MSNALTPDPGDVPPGISLCDLIPALRLREGGVQHFLERIDPVIFDELHAPATHRGMDTADLAAEFLEACLRRDVGISATLPVAVTTLGFICPGWPYTQLY